MKVALMNEFSQASKNALILRALENSARKYGVECYNTGMKSDMDCPALNYMHLGIQAFILLNSGAVDFVVTGCGSGQGACMSLNSFPGVFCAYVADPSDAFLFTQINNGNAAALPFAKDFGWAAELKLEDIFDKIFGSEWGKGYPAKMRDIQQANSRLFGKVKTQICRPPVEILQTLDSRMVRDAIANSGFRECFTAHAGNSELASYVLGLLDEQAC